MNPSVLAFCPQFRPAVGARRQAGKLVAALVDAGCPVTILTLRIDPTSLEREVSIELRTLQRLQAGGGKASCARMRGRRRCVLHPSSSS